MRPVVALFLIGAATSPLIADVRGSSARSSITRQDAASSANDFYYRGDERIRVTRSAEEIVVRFSIEPEPDQQNVMRLLGPGARLGPRIVSEGRAFQLIVLAPGTTDVSAAVNQLQALDQIDFAAPVFLDLTTRQRLVPTDEVIVKLKRGVSRADLVKLFSAPGLTIVRTMVGSSDEYVLRLPRGIGDPLGMSRTLYESGHFEWVEPNFIHEMQKRENVR